MDPDHAPLWGILSVMTEMGLARIYLYTKFEVSSFTRFRFTEGGLKFNFCHWTLTTLFWGYFVMLEMGLARSIRVLNFKFLSSPVLDLHKGLKI